MIMIGKDQRRAPIVAQRCYFADLFNQFLVSLTKAAVLYPVNTRFAGNDGLLQVAPVRQVLGEVMEFGNIFSHVIFLDYTD